MFYEEFCLLGYNAVKQLLQADLLLVFFFNPTDGGKMFLQNFKGLHSIISQKKQLFTTTALRTANTSSFVLN
jgi:hypothetical protein